MNYDEVNEILPRILDMLEYHGMEISAKKTRWMDLRGNPARPGINYQFEIANSYEYLGTLITSE